MGKKSKKGVDICRNPRYKEAPEYYIVSVEALTRKGYNTSGIAKALGIGDSTLREWLLEYPELKQAYMRGLPDATLMVEDALYRRAIGFEYEEETIECGIIDGKEVNVVKTQKKKALPDVKACIYWLNNRNRERWKNNPTEEQAGNITINIHRNYE